MNSILVDTKLNNKLNGIITYDYPKLWNFRFKMETPEKLPFDHFLGYNISPVQRRLHLIFLLCRSVISGKC